jgi:hypothetical protein
MQHARLMCVHMLVLVWHLHFCVDFGLELSALDWFSCPELSCAAEVVSS